MPHLILTARFTRGVARCDAFLTGQSEPAALKARSVILGKLRLLEGFPEFGRPYRPDRRLRELVIPFGRGGYLALYRYAPEEDAVYLIGFRHQREAGYGD